MHRATVTGSDVIVYNDIPELVAAMDDPCRPPQQTLETYCTVH